MSAPFIVFYRHHGQDYSAPFNTMHKARQFARLTGGRVESRLAAAYERAIKDKIRAQGCSADFIDNRLIIKVLEA
jgi:hypothetical protein